MKSPALVVALVVMLLGLAAESVEVRAAEEREAPAPQLPETFDLDDIAHLDLDAFAPEAERRGLAAPPTGSFTAADAAKLCVTNSARAPASPSLF